MMKRICIALSLLLGIFASLEAKDYYIAVNGNDGNKGTINAPFATINKAESLVKPGDRVYIRGGVYRITDQQVMNSDRVWAYVFEMQKSGTDREPICYFGYKNERPIFDLSDVKPANKRIIVFHVKGSYLHFKNFEVVGTQVTILTHTQSECFRNDGGDHNIYENLAMHDGMAIGFYLIQGSDNLVLNCDAYNNYDSVSEGGYGGNVDGFGGHPANESSTGNVFRGCRAWYNSDDGYDLIRAHASVTFDHCWAFLNGYKPNSLVSAADGNGFKSGGYGMLAEVKAPGKIPMHVIKYCLAYYNKASGFYANHHLGGDAWYNNTAYKNSINFNMLNRKSIEEVVNVDGYGHILKNNLSFDPRRQGGDIMNINLDKCMANNNSFLPYNMSLDRKDFVTLDPSQLTRPRKADGSLPDIDFMKLKKGSEASQMNLGCFSR